MIGWLIDSSSLIHAMNVGLGEWTAGQPVPSDAYRFLDKIFSGPEKLFVNNIIISEIIAGSAKDGGLLENWVDENVKSERIIVDQLTPEELRLRLEAAHLGVAS